MKKIKVSPGQLNFFEQVQYSGKKYNTLRAAMIDALQDFYIKKVCPEKICAFDEIYDLKKMKKYWKKYDLQDVCVC